MITCSNCGEPAAAGAATCRRCGLPLSGGVGRAADSQKVAPPQPELPAWLESLRAGERTPPTGSGQISFSAADLIDEESLPGWMRAEQRGDTAEFTFPSGPQQAWNPAQGGGAGAFTATPPQGITARSLIDEQALPSWMREGQTPASAPASATPSATQLPAGLPGAQPEIGASSLVQPDALPAWMRSLEPSSGPSTAPAPAAPTPSASSRPPEQPAPAGLNQPLNARDLIDPQQLPAWMRGQESGSGPGPTAGGQTQLNAGALLDMNALPSWLREGQQESTPAAAPAPAPRPGMLAAPPAGNLTAASLIDMSALPDWLRSSVDVPASSPGEPARPQPAATVPPRVENMRVPSRPRSEPGINQQSEAAANAFASLLGVASAAPSLPPQGGALQGGDPRYGQVPPAAVPQGVPSPLAPPPGYSPTYGPGSQTPAYPPAGASQASAPAPTEGQAQQQARPARRSFLDVIRSWFPRQV